VPRIALCAALLAALALAGCSLKADDGSGNVPGAAPVSGAKPNDANAAQQLGFPVSATRNTTRVSGSDAIADAAGIASALFPAGDASTRPPAVVLTDKDDWQGAIAAGALGAAPIRAPILLTDGDSIPAVTAQTLDRLKPKGITVPNPAQAILVGDKTPPPAHLKSTVIKGGDPYQVSANVDHFASVVRGKPSPDVIVTTGEKSEFAMPAAAWAARSGDAVLFVQRDSIPAPTKTALTQHQKPRIFVLGPASAVSANVLKQLGRFGKVRRIAANNAVDNAIAFARFKTSGFGWGAVVPGQNLSVANQSRPGDAAAAAGLGANGVFAPLLLTDKATPLPRALESYLLDIQPGFEGNDPSQGVYNHVWILGGGDAIAPDAQARIDAATALVPVSNGSGG
jgi:putative cell wall binding repeat protein